MKRAASRSKSPMRRFVTCHICGREFGSASIEIHQKSCRKKWEQEEAAKPAHLRRPVPEAPVAGPVGSQAYNEAASAAYNDKALVPCERCGRTFLGGEACGSRRNFRSNCRTVAAVTVTVRKLGNCSDSLQGRLNIDTIEDVSETPFGGLDNATSSFCDVDTIWIRNITSRYFTSPL